MECARMSACKMSVCASIPSGELQGACGVRRRPSFRVPAVYGDGRASGCLRCTATAGQRKGAERRIIAIPENRDTSPNRQGGGWVLITAQRSHIIHVGFPNVFVNARVVRKLIPVLPASSEHSVRRKNTPNRECNKEAAALATHVV